jgi:5'-3' exonuclease
MEKLGVGLRTLAAARTGWAVSCAAESGEGEQKVMAWIRANPVGGKSVVVYGLDADLIVLSLLAVARDVPDVAEWRLLRELAEFEGGRGDGGFGALNIRELLSILVPTAMPADEYCLEYACGMSFLGNDFLPHSLSVKMREGGHDMLCRVLAEIHGGGGRLVRDGIVQPAVALELVRRWAGHEEQFIAENFEHKYKGRPMAPRNERERLMQPYERLPKEWRAESAIWSLEKGLVPNWREEYRRKWLYGASPKKTVGQYLTGLQWIMDYYQGKPISYSWYFPWNVPPLWGDLEAELRAGAVVKAAPPTPPVAPQEQLAMVLPMESWWLVRDPKLRALPGKLPAFWPKRFGFFSVGRRWLWECEADVPVIGVERLKQLV